MIKTIKPKNCKVCKEKFNPIRSIQPTCLSYDCQVKYAIGVLEKKKLSDAIKSRLETKVKLLKLKTKSEYANEAQIWFNKFIRLRDAALECISCGKYHPGKIDAGHYRTVGSSPHCRFDERNCHAQCQPCNRHKSGNIINYRINLCKRYGQEMVLSIESDNTPKHYTIEDLKTIKLKYMKLCKEIECKVL